ncbi:endonuclease domain-containing protein [Luedemannella flava]
MEAADWARSDREARGIVATSFQQGFVRLDDVLAAVDRAPRAKRRKLVVSTARDAANGATSLGELDLLDAIRGAGLPEPQLQWRRRDAGGKMRYLDGYYPEYGLHLEVDGAQHNNPVQAWDDMARQNALWRQGDRVLRFPAWLVRDQPNIVAAQVRDALRAAGWRGQWRARASQSEAATSRPGWTR